MAKGMYFGVGGVAHKVKKMYFGVGGVARKVKKAYIGVGGVARLFWSGGELAYYGTATALSTARYSFGVAAVGNYALIAGGSNSSYLDSVEAYDKNLTKSAPSVLSSPRASLRGASVGEYALFYTGIGPDGDFANTRNLDAYNASLTRTILSLDYTGPRAYGSASTGKYAFFAGGVTSRNVYQSAVHVRDASLTTHSVVPLSPKRSGVAGASVAGYAIFTGGADSESNYMNVTEAYNASLTAVSVDKAGGYASHASANGIKHAMFAGGTNSMNTTTVSDTMDRVVAYDSYLTKTVATVLSVGRRNLCGCGIGRYVIFAGGITKNSAYSKVVDVYDESLTRTTTTNLSVAHNGGRAVAVDNFALVAGGETASGTYTSVVDVYTVA